MISCFSGECPLGWDMYRKRCSGWASFSVLGNMDGFKILSKIYNATCPCCSSRIAFSMTGRDSSSSSAICSGDLPFLPVVGAALTYHRYNFPALSNRILSMISFALLTERYPSSIFSVRTLHSEKRNARSEP